MSDVTVLGSGSWGTALAVLLSKKGYKVHLWGRDKEKVETLNRTRENIHYLPGVMLPTGIVATTDLEEALNAKKYVILSVPSAKTRQLCKNIKGLINEDQILINTSKGIETDTLKRMSEVIEEELVDKSPQIAVLSGPSHAEEVGKDIPTAVVIGSKNRKVAEEIQNVFMSPKFRVYTNPDMIGIELGAALKNVIALGTGIADGIGYGDNTKAALITRGLTEIARLGEAVGADVRTFAGLTGIGDLIVTCTSMHSRNRRAGILIGKGDPLDVVLKKVGMVVEGVTATEAGYKLGEKYKISMPICQQTYEVLFNNKNPKEAVVELMMRQKTHEVEEVAVQDKW
ncbi:MAG: NAD(P)H-dependent glycerol-3-phosphate dehydrogenase [Clostridia bacterium]|nr:NAD(P)H-dependent glycerol-3-phosphate dehydrogenase [Clostridia bacterium]MDD4048208.1 NAD(P)H-dependent glycerol-3-phosphate dehydrogenase [Clostridia bacterium]